MTSPKKAKCQCGKGFPNQNALNQHCKATGHGTVNKNTVKCPNCNKQFKTQQAMQQHIASKHKPPKKINCPQCSKKFKSKLDCKKHIESIHNVKCPHCEKGLKTQAGLKQHIENVHEFKCPHCSQVLYSRLLLQTHIEETHKEKMKDSFICHDCKKVFKNKSALDQHTKSIGHISKSIGLYCSQCKKSFKDQLALKNHMNSAAHKKQPKEKKPDFKCPHCQNKFKTQQSMNQHISMKHRKQVKKKAKKEKLGLALFEKISLKERFLNTFRKLLKKKKVLIMDECVGDDNSVVEALHGHYHVRPLPKELISHSDKDIRLVLSAKKWGLISKDFEMVMLAREMKIKPVYFLTEKRDNRDLIRISKLNYKIS